MIGFGLCVSSVTPECDETMPLLPFHSLQVMMEEHMKMREIFDTCEFCHNSSDVMYFESKKFGRQYVVGEFIKYQLKDETGTVISYRCDNHFTEEECEEFNKEHDDQKWSVI